MKVKILGAGSIGNHIAQASRRMGWEVAIVDTDPAALERTKKEIYPKRYGDWDEGIKLFESDKAPRGGFDIVIIGTPPDSHMQLAMEALDENPGLIHVEKPLATPGLEKVAEFTEKLKSHPKTAVVVGYDHAVAESVEEASRMVREGLFGKIITIDVEFREHWKGIFAAHPWLAGPWETYLGYWKRGGGAGGEHSHALHLWLHFAKVSGWGNAASDRTKATFDFQQENGAEYDRIAAFLLETDRGEKGRVVQDVVTHPSRKWARLQGERGYIEWYCNGVPEGDLVRYQQEGKGAEERVFAKKRPDDFYREVLHYKKILNGEIKSGDSPLSLQSGLDVMDILNKSYNQR